MAAPATRRILTLLKSEQSNPPALLEYRSSKWFLVTTICVAIFTDIFLYGIIVPVIPFALTTRCRVAESDVQHWVSVLLAVYGASLLAGSPPCGWLADRSSSRRLPLLTGLLALGGATLMLCFGRTIGVLIAARVLQGVAAAVVWTVGLALLVDTVGPHEVGQMMGYVTISMSVAILVAPLLGGVVYDRTGYYGVYYMAFALIIIDIVFRLIMVEKKIAKKWIDPSEPTNTQDKMLEANRNRESGRNSILSIPDSIRDAPVLQFKVANKGVVEKAVPDEGLVQKDDQGVQHLEAKPSARDSQKQPHQLRPRPDTIEEAPELDSLAIEHSICEPKLELPSTAPLDKTRRRLPPVLTLLASRRLLFAIYCSLVQSILLTAWDAVLPLYVNKLFGWHSLGAGLIFLPVVLPSFLSPLVGAFSDKYGARLPACIGFVITTPFVILLRLVNHSGVEQVVLLCALLALVGTGLTIVLTPVLAEFSYIVGTKEKKHPGLFGEKGAYAQAYGLFNCAFAGGMLVGPLWAGTVVQREGWAMMCLTLGILSLVSAIPAGLFIGGWIGKRRRAGVAAEREEMASSPSAG
ncbi:MAG: hypothetical protein LQ351_000955 [Letrouitia transgressa]|nr:MAG: hypothetical protein LQ351_000955 [Letrouitia transgressa]